MRNASTPIAGFIGAQQPPSTRGKIMETVIQTAQLSIMVIILKH